MRLFAGERIYKILDRLGTTDDEGNEEPIEAGMLSKQIEKAQRKVEEQHFLQRKHTLEYDDVSNQQREVVYRYRDDVLEGRDMSETAREQIAVMMERLVEEYTAGDFVEDWDVTGLLRRIDEIFTPSNEIQSLDANTIDREELTATLQDEMLDNYEAREEQLGTELMRALERFLLLQIIDQRWTEHLHDLDYLQQGIHLRGIGGMTDPLVIYKNEAFTLFEDLMNLIWADFARMIFHVEVTVEGDGDAPPPPPARRSAPGSSSSTRGRNVTYSGGTGVPSGAMAMAAAAGSAAAAGDSEAYDDEGGGMLPPVVEQRRVDESEQIGRNDPCWCGSGKKFKKCHGA